MQNKKINLIDTAKSYGSFKEVLGNYFSEIYSITKIDNVSTDLEEHLWINTVLAHMKCI